MFCTFSVKTVMFNNLAMCNADSVLVGTNSGQRILYCIALYCTVAYGIALYIALHVLHFFPVRIQWSDCCGRHVGSWHAFSFLVTLTVVTVPHG